MLTSGTSFSTRTKHRKLITNPVPKQKPAHELGVQQILYLNKLLLFICFITIGYCFQILCSLFCASKGASVFFFGLTLLNFSFVTDSFTGK